MLIESKIRELAKSDKYMNLFYATKELNGIRLFRNDCDFSRIQHMFLNYLYFYEIIFKEIANKKINDFILTNEIYEDAYYYWKSKNINKEEKTDKKVNTYFHVSNKIKFPEEKSNG